MSTGSPYCKQTSLLPGVAIVPRTKRVEGGAGAGLYGGRGRGRGGGEDAARVAVEECGECREGDTRHRPSVGRLVLVLGVPGILLILCRTRVLCWALNYV